MDQLGGGEAVVELDQVEVLGSDTCLLVRLERGVSGQGVDVGQHLAALLPGVTGEHRGGHLHGARCCSPESVLSLAPLTSTAAAAPSQLAEHIGRVLG